MSENAVSYVAGPVPAGAGAGGRRRLRVVADRGVGYEPQTDPAGPTAQVPTASPVDAGDREAVDPDVALAALRRAADLVARADLDLLDDRGLLEHTVALDRQVTRLEAQRLRALARVDERAAFTEDACVTAGSWFKMRTNRDPNVGARLARWTRRLARFPQLRAAFEEGTVTEDHVLAVLRTARGRRQGILADHEETLVTLAQRAEPRDVRAACQAIIDAFEHVEPEGCGPSDARQLYHATTIGGLGDLRATLDPVTAERLDNLLHAYSHQPDSPDSPDTPDEDRRSPAQARHDAFDAILRAAEQHPDISQVQGAKPHLIVYADLFTLLGRPDLASRPTTKLGSGRPIDLDRIVHLLEDAKATGVLNLGPFRPVAFGRTQRTIPGWLRTVLAAIHGTCAGPGCDRPVAWTDAAHTDTPWAHGGTTELDTTIPACRGTNGHHNLIDIAGWNVDLDPNTRITRWTSPDRRTTITTNPPDP